MTTIVGLSRTLEYALVSKDSMAFTLTPDVDGGRPFLQRKRQPMVRPVSRYVLAVTGGCFGISDDCWQRLEQRLSASDGMSACVAAAREVMDELVDVDRDLVGTRYRALNISDDCFASRLSVLEHFNLQLLGFEPDGRTRAAVWARGEWQECERPEGELHFCQPYGTDDFDDSFYDDFYAGEEPLELADAFAFAFGVHRLIGATHPDRISADVSVTALRWCGFGRAPDTLHLECDRDDLDNFYAAYASLSASPRSDDLDAAIVAEAKRLTGGGRNG